MNGRLPVNPPSPYHVMTKLEMKHSGYFRRMHSQNQFFYDIMNEISPTEEIYRTIHF